jgi:hypothetical protein
VPHGDLLEPELAHVRRDLHYGERGRPLPESLVAERPSEQDRDDHTCREVERAPHDLDRDVGRGAAAAHVRGAAHRVSVSAPAARPQPAPVMRRSAW